MNALLHRALVAFTGMPDTMATPLPGFWGRAGGARVDTYAHCTGGCHGGKRACDCTTGCVELHSDIAPDADRVIQPPDPLPDDVRSRMNRLALYLSALGFGVVAGLLEAFGAAPFTRDLP